MDFLAIRQQPCRLAGFWSRIWMGSCFWSRTAARGRSTSDSGKAPKEGKGGYVIVTLISAVSHLSFRLIAPQRYATPPCCRTVHRVTVLAVCFRKWLETSSWILSCYTPARSKTSPSATLQRAESVPSGTVDGVSPMVSCGASLRPPR